MNADKLPIDYDLLPEAFKRAREYATFKRSNEMDYIERFLDAQSRYIQYVAERIEDYEIPTTWSVWLQMYYVG